MNTLVLCPSYSRGLQDYTHNLAAGLDTTDIEFRVLVNEQYAHTIDTPHIKEAFSSDRIDSVQSLFSEIRDHDPNIVHSQSTNLPLLSALIVLKKIFDYKLVLTPHSSKSHWDRPIYETIQPYIFNQFDGIIWHTEQDRDRMKASGVNTNQVVIPHGNYSFYSESSSMPSVEKAREQLELPKDAAVFLFFGYLRPDKRLDLLLTAFREMSEEMQSQAALVIAGKPVSGFEEYRSMISEYGIEDRVYTWPEFIDDAELPMFFQAADAVVTPYDTISESGVIHIASGFGKPIIATNTEGFEERLQHKENGLLVEPDSVPELRRALEYAIENEEEMEQYGKQNQQESKENEWEDIAEQTVRFYQEVTNDD